MPPPDYSLRLQLELTKAEFEARVARFLWWDAWLNVLGLPPLAAFQLKELIDSLPPITDGLAQLAFPSRSGVALTGTDRKDEAQRPWGTIPIDTLHSLI